MRIPNRGWKIQLTFELTHGKKVDWHCSNYDVQGSTVHLSKAIIEKSPHCCRLAEPYKAPVSLTSLHMLTEAESSLSSLWTSETKKPDFSLGRGGRPSTWSFSRKRMRGGWEGGRPAALTPNWGQPKRKKGGAFIALIVYHNH